MKTFGFVLTFLLSFATYAGGITSVGGDDLLPSDGSAWFLGTKPIRACVEMSSDFGPSELEVRKTILKVFETWKQYIAKKDINRDPRPEDLSSLGSDLDLGGYNNPRDVLSGAAGGQRLATRSQLLSACDGTEDLKFILGLENEEVRQAKKNFSRPIAFAQRTSYDTKLGWGKGYIWVAPPSKTRGGKNVWTLSSSLLGVLLHEVGHVYGNSHVEGTIMGESVPMAASEGNENAEAFANWMFTQIDQDHELFYCHFCNFHFENSTKAISQIFPEHFQKMTGRSSVGPVRTQLYATRKGYYDLEINFVITDDLGSIVLRSSGFPRLIGKHNGDTPLFKKAFEERSAELKSDATSEIIKMVNQSTGKKFTMILQRNMYRTATLQLIDPEEGDAAYVFVPKCWTDEK